MWRQLARFSGVSGVVVMMGGVAHAQTFPVPVAPGATSPTPPAPPGAAPSVTPTVAPPPANAECFPTCRAGFTCHQGQCISLCNPACSSDERCNNVGECEKQPAVQAPAVVPPPAPAPPLPPPTTEAPASRAPLWAEPSVLRAPGTFVFQAHLGLELFSTGHSEDSCTSSRPNECVGAETRDFEGRSHGAIAIAGAFHVSRGLRLGVGYWALPHSGIRGSGANGQKAHLGHEHALNAIVEGLVPLRPKLALSLRAHAGPRMLIVGGDLKTETDRFLSDCSRERVGHHCEAKKGPFFGATFGTLVGIVVGDRARWRADLGVERYSLKAGETSVSREANAGIPSYNGTDEAMLYATRFWLLTGLEL